MTDVFKNIGKIWSRLFDHRSFLSGEIQYQLNEFEQKRGDLDVDNLFKIIEFITEIKESDINKFKEAVNQTLPNANKELSNALEIYDKFEILQNKYKESDSLLESRRKRKANWDNFIDEITSSYSEINSKIELEEQKLTTLYSDLEKKLTKKQ